MSRPAAGLTKAQRRHGQCPSSPRSVLLSAVLHVMHVTYSPQRNDRELERKHVDKEIRSGDGGGTDGVHSTGCIELCEPDRVTTAIRIYDDVADKVKSMGAEQRPVLWFAETCVIKWLAPVRADR